jgi:hypothetical protein
MTEQEWLACAESLECIRGLPKAREVSETRLRRLAIAICQHCRRWLSDDCRMALDAAERCMDGMARDGERTALAEIVEANYRDLVISRSRRSPDGMPTIHERAAQATYCVSAWEDYPVHYALGSVTALAKGCEKDRECVALFREVLGNPFRPVTLDPRWQSETVTALASGIYADRAFDRMPILADALEDAGCDHPDILAHCRGDGPHARGCWVVDLVLGKD